MAHPLKFAAEPTPTRRSIGRGPIIGAAIASTVLAVGLGGWLALRAGAPPTRLMQPAAMTGTPVAATSTAGQASAGTTPRATGNGGLPAVAVVARSPQPAARLTISVHVAGTSGRVRSDDGVIDCPGRCTATYPSGRQVSLHASAAGFLGWSGCPQPDGTACTLGGDASFFPRASYRVAAATSITGTSTGTPSAPPTQSLAPALPTQSVTSPTRPITSPTQSVTYGSTSTSGSTSWSISVSPTQSVTSASTSTSTSPTQYPIGEVPGTGATAGANPTGTPSGGTSGVGGIG